MHKPPSNSSALPTFSIALLIVVIVTAFVDPSRLPLLFIPLSFLFASYGVGLLWERVLQKYASPLPTHLPMLVLATRLGTGIALVGWTTTVLGQLGFYRVSGILLLLALGWSLFCIATNPPSFQTFRPSILSIIGGTWIGVVWTIAWLWATIPPTFYDELAYHLPIAQQALRTGTIPATPWLFFTFMPHLSDLLLGWGLALAGDIGARAMHITFWFATWIAAWALIETLSAPMTSPWIGYALTGAFASSAMFLFLGTLPFAETLLTFAVLTSVALLLGSTAQSSWLSVGLLWGLTLSVKLSGTSWVLTTALAALVLSWPASSLVRAGLVALITASPWWGRAWWLTGNPVYPLGYHWIHSQYWDDTSQARLQEDLPSFTNPLDILALLRLPLDMIMAPERFGSASECGRLAVIAACLMLILPVLGIFVNENQQTRRRCYAAGVFMFLAGASWLMTSITTRFFAPALMTGLCVLVALLLRLPPTGLTISLVALLALGAEGATRFLSIHTQVFTSGKVAVGQESRSAFAERTLDHYGAAQYVKAYLPPDANLLFIGESRPFYFDRRALAPHPFHHHPLAVWLQEAETPEQLRDRIRREGFTHVILNTREFKRLQDQYRILPFSGPDGSLHNQRLRQLPKTMVTLFSQNSVYVLEVPALP